jgi:hypothetical protein
MSSNVEFDVRVFGNVLKHSRDRAYYQVTVVIIHPDVLTDGILTAEQLPAGGF